MKTSKQEKAVNLEMERVKLKAVESKLIQSKKVSNICFGQSDVKEGHFEKNVTFSSSTENVYDKNTLSGPSQINSILKKGSEASYNYQSIVKKPNTFYPNTSLFEDGMFLII